MFYYTKIYGYLQQSEKSAVFFDEAYGVSVKPEKGSENYFVLLQRELAKKKERAEFRRLIYVAIRCYLYYLRYDMAVEITDTPTTA